MERRAAERSFLLITVLLGYSIVFSSPAIIPTIRNPSRIWKRDLSEQSISNKELNSFLSRPDSWSHQIPSITLHDWGIKMLSSDVLSNDPSEEATRKLIMQPIARQMLFSSNDVPKKMLPEDAELNRVLTEQRWLPVWPTNEMEKRSIVVADDAAFRERSKMLTAMERQKWLNSYMQKLLVVNST
ncbi:tuberoinfundibular peptide of 39 residues [Pseudophryne corroboree]|uniref:tuberoinfundibular peptide of 39 residues n=1 Tax=Pseudophryne corroboree TaxID=495146 RepID=UPI003081C4F5